MCQVQACGGAGYPGGPLGGSAELAAEQTSGARMLPSLTGRGVSGVVFPVTLACPPAHSWPEKAIGRYRQGEGKQWGPRAMPQQGHSQ